MIFSASRIALWISCNRAAGFQYFADFEQPATVDTDFGGRVHAILERWSKDGGHPEPNLLDPAEAVAAEALPYVVPLWGPQAEVEGALDLRGRHAWRGRLDLVPSPGYVIDYKTTSDFKYAKDLRVDPQALLYATFELRRHPELEACRLRWLYLLKRTPHRALPVDYVMSRAEAERGFAVLESFADEMQAAANASANIVDKPSYVLTLLPNFNACSNYRGCPHRHRCKPPLFLGEHTMSSNDFLSRLQAASAPTPARPTLEMPAPAAVTFSPPAPAAVTFSPPAPAAPAAVPFSPPAPAAVTFSPPAPAADADIPAGFSFVDTQDESLPSKYYGELSQFQKVIFNQFGKVEGAFVVPDPSDTAAVASPPPQPPQPPPPPATTPDLPSNVAINPPPRKPGRPPGAKNKATLAAAPPPPPAITFAPPSPPAPPVAPLVTAPATPLGAPPAPLADAAPGRLQLDRAPPAPLADAAPEPIGAVQLGVLFLGCRPSGGTLVTFELIWARARAQVGEDKYYKNYGYKANAMMLETFERLLSSEYQGADILVGHPGTPEAMLCLSLLLSAARVVVERV
jgi:hypothetical protein